MESMKNRIIYFGLLLCLIVFAGCKDEFGKTLFGPEDTVAPEKVTDRTLVFLNTTDAENIANGTAVTADPVDVIFSAVQPVGQVKEIKTSAKLTNGKSKRDQVFTVSVLQDEAVLQQYKETNGYRVKFLPAEAYHVATNLINIEYDATMAISQSLVKIINSSKLDLDQDYLLALQLNTAEGFTLDDSNRTLYLHVKRKGGSGEAQGAADLRPMAGDDALDAEGVDLGINRNNLYYQTEGYAFQKLNACTLEGLVYVDSFKAASERGDATLACISSVWGYEAGSDAPFLMRFGDAGVDPNKLQVKAGGKTLLVNYSFREKTWYHIALTYDGTNIRVYVNSRERASMAHTGTLDLAGAQFVIGQSFNQWRGFNGMMSEIRIWNTARTAAQLRENALDVVEYESEKSDLLAYWKLNGAKPGSDNKQIADFTGNGHDLTVKRQGAASAVQPKVVINQDIDINLK